MKKTKMYGYLYLYMLLFFSYSVDGFPIKWVPVGNLVAINIKGEKLNLINGKAKYIIFYNSVNCINCFKEINNYLRIRKIDTCSIICLIRADDNSNKSNLRTILKEAKENVFAGTFCFDIHNPERYVFKEFKGGLFEKYKITKTPAILFVGDSLNLYLYEDLFFIGSKLENILK